MARLFPAFLLLSACSTGLQGYEKPTTTGPSTTTSTTEDVTPSGDDDDDDDDDSDPGDPVETCTPPLDGVVPGQGVCEYEPNPSGTPFSATIEWAMTHEVTNPATGAVTPRYTWSEYPEYGSVFQAPAVVQITDDNGDGVVGDDDVPDIAVVMAHPDDPEDGVLRLISGDGNTVHDSTWWQTYTNANGTHDYAPYHYAGLAVADLDGDDRFEIATLVTQEGTALCYPAVYEVVPRGAGVELQLDVVYEGGDYYCGGHAPAVADLAGNGDLEVLYGRAVFTPELELEWYGDGGRGWYGRGDYPFPEGYWNSGYHSFAYDIDGDGSTMEVVSGRTVYTALGSTYCELGWYQGSTWVPATDGYNAVGDLVRFNGDVEGEPGIVITGNEYVRVFHGVPDYDPNGLARCTLVAELPNDPLDDPAMAGLPAHPVCDATAKSFGGPPTIADFNGDGDREIAVAGACWYSVYHFTAGTMERYAVAETKDWSSSSTGSTVFDFNGDGSSEVVFSDEDAVYVWGVDDAGANPWDRLVPYLVDRQHKSWTVHEYPLVADVDGDGKAEILVANSHLPGFEDHFGLYVLGAEDDDWVSARPVWNQHAYYVTNVEDDGTTGYGMPNYAPFNPADLNGFRIQAPGSFGALAAPDAIAQVSACQETCGDLTVWVQVGNEADFISVGPDVVVSLYGVDPTGGRTLIADRSLGTFVDPLTLSAPVEFRVSASVWSSYDEIVALVDDPVFGTAGEGRAKECDELDNEASLPLTGYCP